MVTIIGLHVDVKAEELRELLRGRVDHHEQKQRGYEQQLSQLRTLGSDETPFQGTSVRDPKEGMEVAIAKHASQAKYFAFMAAHVVEGAVYRLDDQALHQLGIKPERY